MTFWERFARWVRRPFLGRQSMMTCREQVDLLADYLDGALDPGVTGALEQHLDGCPSCLNFIKTYKATTVLVREIPCEEMPEELMNRLTSFLKAKIRQEKAGGDRRETPS
ncbi:MAG TPA: zf-HC2 domain-containing protein [Candidatus Methylomirabilis sp.]|nr:zf-HC2 domain-containing protein [Candidatus Methylomirabilis sp.]